MTTTPPTSDLPGPSLIPGGPLTTHRLRITLLDVTPPVWRELRVPSVATLRTLHLILQVAFGWEDRHLHEWRVGELTYGFPDEDSWGEELADESEAVLADVAPEDSSFTYAYDFGDGWEHLVEVEAIEPYDATTPPLACLDGARSAPPEDCGGPFGYEHLLDSLADPDDSEHDQMVEWVGNGWSPEAFDLQSVNEALAPLWRPDLGQEEYEPDDPDDEDGAGPV